MVISGSQWVKNIFAFIALASVSHRAYSQYVGRIAYTVYPTHDLSDVFLFEKNEIIQNEEEWNRLWKSHRNIPDSYPIEFNDQTVLFVSIGGHTGHDVVFGDIIEMEDVIHANVIHLKPGVGCAVLQMFTYQTAIAIIPKTNKKVKYSIDVADINCNERR